MENVNANGGIEEDAKNAENLLQAEEWLKEAQEELAQKMAEEKEKKRLDDDKKKKRLEKEAKQKQRNTKTGRLPLAAAISAL